MITFVHQPEYLPWMGFFDKLARCDIFVVYDDAQFVHGGFHNRNRIRTCKGWRWITIPIVHNHPQMIKDVKISGSKWREEHLQVLIQNYEKSPFFNNYFPIIEKALNSNHEFLIDLNMHLIQNVAEILKINPKTMRSSEFSYYGKEKTEKLVSMCRFLGSDTYLSGNGGRAYVNEKAFAEANIKLQWHNYNHPLYKQQFEGFEPNMSIVDLLFNMGPYAKEVLLSGGTIEEKPAAPELTSGNEIIRVAVPQNLAYTAA